MRGIRLQILIVPCLVCLPALIRAQQLQVVKSPDGMLMARVTPASKRCGENRLAIFKIRRALVYRKDFSSSDCEHGDVIVRGQWTADSRFFVFNVESTGGHQPGHRPVLFYSRRSNRLYHLENYMGYIVAEDFSLEAPHIIRTQRQKQIGGNERVSVEIDLDQLLRHRRVKHVSAKPAA